jgi:hypothetical protein
MPAKACGMANRTYYNQAMNPIQITLLVFVALVHGCAQPATRQIELNLDPDILVFSGPLLPDGRIDYAAALNTHHNEGVTSENNAYRAIYLLMGRDFVPGDGSYSAKVATQFDELLDIKPEEIAQAPRFVRWYDYAEQRGIDFDEAMVIEDSAWDTAFDHAKIDTLVAWIESCEPFFDRLDQAVALPEYWRPWIRSVHGDNQGVVVTSSGLSEIRAMARALDTKAKWALHTGRPQVAAECVVTMTGLAQQVARGGGSIELLVGFSIDAMVYQLLHDALIDKQFDSDSIDRVLACLNDRSDAGRLAEIFYTTERALQISMYLTLALDMESLNDWIIFEVDARQLLDEIDRVGLDYSAAVRRLSGYVTTQSEQARARSYREYLSLTEQEGQTLAERLEVVQDRYIVEEAEDKFRIDLSSTRFERDSLTDLTVDLYFGMVAQANEAVARTMYRQQAQLAVARATLACERYRLKHSEYPATLDMLVPEVLPEQPIDPMDGQALRYRRNIDGIAVVYSVNTNLEDDGGSGDINDSQSMRDGDYAWHLSAVSK